MGPLSLSGADRLSIFWHYWIAGAVLRPHPHEADGVIFHSSCSNVSSPSRSPDKHGGEQSQTTNSTTSKSVSEGISYVNSQRPRCRWPGRAAADGNILLAQLRHGHGQIRHRRDGAGARTKSFLEKLLFDDLSISRPATRLLHETREWPAESDETSDSQDAIWQPVSS